MIRFTIGPCAIFEKRKAWDSNPHGACGAARFSKPARRTVSGYLPKVELARVELAAETLQESLVPVTVSPQLVESRRVELRF